MTNLRLTATLLSVAITLTALVAQTHAPAPISEQAQVTDAPVELFDVSKNLEKVTNLEVLAPETHQLLDLNPDAVSKLRDEVPAKLNLKLPGKIGALELRAFDFYGDDFRVMDLSTGEIQDYERGIHYEGKVAGDEHSLAVISIYPDEVTGMVTTQGTNWNLGKIIDDKFQRHVLFDAANVPKPAEDFCGTETSQVPYTKEQLMEAVEDEKNGNDCVGVTLIADYSVFVGKGSNGTNLNNYLTSLFAQVAILYANENVVVTLNQVNWYSSEDPFPQQSTETLLPAFREAMNNWNGWSGDLCQYVTYETGGGRAYRLLDFCDRSYGYGVNEISGTFSNVPTYSYETFVITHEMGHNFGSNHTHDCVWNGNGTAIDNCEPTNCNSRDGIPANGGTIMSYCYLVGDQSFVNYALGFGRQPGNLIRNTARNAPCATGCGVDCRVINTNQDALVSANTGPDDGTQTIYNPFEFGIFNNAWKAVTVNYTVTANTKVAFEFGSQLEGEVHGFAFTNTSGVNGNNVFKVHGTQNWGRRNYDNYDVAPRYKEYVIPVGQFYTGFFSRLLFLADKDAGNKQCSSFFRSFRIYEGNDVCEPPRGLTSETPYVEINKDLTGIVSSAGQANEVPYETELTVMPNPARDHLTAGFTSTTDTRANVRLMDISGRTVLERNTDLTEGYNQLDLNVNDLKPGTYLLRMVTAEGESAVRKVAIIR